MTIGVDIEIASNEPGIPHEAEIRSWLEAVIGHASDDENIEIAVRIVDENEGRELNKRFRQRDKATNVLSFPAGSPVLPHDAPRPLGDIVICGPIVAREASDQGKDLRSHWAHMLVHGVLHLLGYDHETDAEAEIMESVEKEMLASRGIDDPYAVRY